METPLKTPCYIYDESVIHQQVKKIIDANISKGNIHFSLMANNNISLLRIIQAIGAGVFTSSMQELAIAKEAGFENKKIIFCSSNLKIEEIEKVIESDPIIIADSFNQLKKYINSGKLRNIGIRISFEPEFYKKNDFLEVQRQGIELHQLPDVLDLCSQHQVRIIGIHSYFGTNNSNEEFFKIGLSRLIEIASHFKDIEFIDGSGGFGLDYRSEGFEFNIAGLVDCFNSEIARHPQLSNSIKLKIEPGRFIIGPAGKLICTVTDVYEKQGKTFIGVDTNLSQFPRPYIYHEYHRINVYSRAHENSLTLRNVYIVGNSIKSDDFFAVDIDFPVVEEGDLLCFSYAGAYCYSMSSNFCAQLRPAEYLYTVNKKFVKIRNEETMRSLLYSYPL